MANQPHEDHGHAPTVKGYLIGFALAVVLTVIPFAIAMTGALSGTAALAVIAVLGVIQIVVHVRFFLHIDSSPAQRTNLAAFSFTLLIIGILVVGSLWILHNMNSHMM